MRSDKVPIRNENEVRESEPELSSFASDARKAASHAVSLHTFLTRLIWFCVLPLVLLATFLSITYIDTLQKQRDREATERMQDFATALNRHVKSRISALQMLADSPLASNPTRIKEFYSEAQAYRKHFNGHVVLADLSKQMLFNTRTPFGAALPKLPQPKGHAAVPEVLATGKPSVGDAFFGPVAKEQLYAVVVPVTRNGRIRALLLTTGETQMLQQRIDDVALPAGWALQLLDRKGEVLAARMPPAVGAAESAQENTQRKITTTLPLSGWSLILFVPHGPYQSPILAAGIALAAAILVVTFVSVLGGGLASRRLARSVASLTTPTTAKGQYPRVTEIEAVRNMLEASTTAQEASEKSLKESEMQFRRLSLEFEGLLDAIPDNLMLLDRDLKIQWANKAAAVSINKTPEELVGKNCFTLWCGQTGPCNPCPVVHSFKSGKLESETVTRPDGRIWDIRTVPLPDEQGGIGKVIEVKRDITEHRKLETQYLHAQKMESIGTLAGGIAHDFNNILSAIIGYAHLIHMKMAQNDPHRPNMESILEAADRAAHLTKDLLLFSRKQVSERTPLDLNEVVKKIEKFLRRVIGEDIECKTIPNDSGLLVLADHHQLEQVLMNFATNARDAMPKGGAFTVQTQAVVLHEDFIRAHGFGRPGPYALMTISDTGIGMDEETRKRIFEPFFTTKEVGKGTGLGLAVVYGIIKQHDGFINVYSELGKGTTFRIYLPILEGALLKNVPKQQEAAPVRGTETVLLAEDDDTVRKLSRTVLEEHGYSVIEAEDGEAAVTLFRQHRDRIDILLFDLIMPKRNGQEAFEEIRKIKRDIKVIFASGYAPDIIQRKSSLEAGAHLIFKPLAPTALLKILRSVLDGEA